MTSITAVIHLDETSGRQAGELAGKFHVPLVDGTTWADAKPKQLTGFLKERFGQARTFVLLMNRDGLRLYAGGELNVLIRADFHGLAATYRRKQGGARGQMIARAVGFKADIAPSVLDCTAGLGGDAFVLASLGCPVTMLERVPVLRALLEDALQQARARGDAVLDGVIKRMRLIPEDALEYLKTCPDLPDVVYLDPMFPKRGKHALVKKNMQVFHALVGADMDADELLPAALAAAQQRVVVKRPCHAPALDGRKPSYFLAGKSNRYDVYVV